VEAYRWVNRYQYVGGTFASILKVVLQHPEDGGKNWLREVCTYSYLPFYVVSNERECSQQHN
jgi:hypothetical protein